ncbi:MAG: YtxH domain-containing protein [Ignavibacteria bacterium]|nr:YtxH domain-containing protein [Ignavibacteria bacterium]
MEDNKSVKGFMLGMLAGGVAGGLLALLYAPKSGVELRGDIRKKSQELLTETGEYIGTAKDRAGEMLSEGRKRAGEFIDDAKEKAGMIQENISNIFTQGKEKLDEEGHKVKDAVKAGVDSFKEERSKQTQNQHSNQHQNSKSRA